MSLLEAAAATLAAVVSVLAILAVVWRYVVLPNLREQLFRPVEETRRQVTENQHVNRPPTVVDRLEDLTNALEDIRSTVDAIGLTQTAVLRVASRLQRTEQRLVAHEAAADAEHRFLKTLIQSLIHEEQELQRKDKDK